MESAGAGINAENIGMTGSLRQRKPKSKVSIPGLTVPVLENDDDFIYEPTKGAA